MGWLNKNLPDLTILRQIHRRTIFGLLASIDVNLNSSIIIFRGAM